MKDSLCGKCQHYMGENNTHGPDQGDMFSPFCLYCRVCNPRLDAALRRTLKEKGK